MVVEKGENMNIYFYADPHFNHGNIIKYCDRPFENVHLMNEHLIKEYNRIVQDDDIVYFLGDIGINKRGSLVHCIERLKGNKILIRGNHDQCGYQTYIKMGFAAVLADATIKVGSRYIKLTHLPVYDIGWNFCGHIHTNWKTDNKCINCGVDQWDFKPVVVQKLVQMMDKYDAELKKFLTNEE
jgi:calcineurin-like phosphoesterase family protein